LIRVIFRVICQGGLILREILISLGVMAACLLLVVFAQTSQPRGESIAAEQSTPAAITATPAISPSPLPDSDPDTMTQTPEANPNTITTASGLQYVDLEEGTGATPEAGQTVYVHYTGTLEDGTKFDSSRDRNQPFSFRLGAGQVIQGWDEGISTMKVGGRRQLIIAPALGYGSRGIGPIPPNSTLLFDVELLRVS
jgi:peptidylprolyl isomerase